MTVQLAQRRQPDGKGFLLLVTLLLGAVAAWVLSNGFLLASASESWAKVIAALGAEEFLLENLTFLTPHIPLYSLIPFYYIPGMDTGAAPYLVSVLVASLLLYLWVRHLKDVDMSRGRTVLLIALIVMHPAFLWGATSGSQMAMSMLAFYLLYRAVHHIISIHDIHSYISLAVVFLFFFFIDGSAVYIFVALLPLLVIIAPRRTVMVSPLAMYLIVGTPFVFAILSWAYLNWIFEGSFLHFVTSPSSHFLGGQLAMDKYPWLQDYGGQFFRPLLVATGYLIIAFPVSVYLLLDTLDDTNRFRATFVLLLHPLIAIAMATSQFYLSHPFEILTLIIAGLMAELTYVKMQTRREFFFLLVFMMVSVVSGWWLFIESASPQMTQWVHALKGDVQLTKDDSDLQLGIWLSAHRQPTLMYEKSGYKVIAARGDAEGMLLSFSHAFKAAMRERVPGVKQIVVPRPNSVMGRKDPINIRHPHLYDHGMVGFHLVYDHMGWRVYRRKDA